MKTIIEMAREADLIDDTYQSDWYVYKLSRFAELVTEQANVRANASWTLMCKKMVAVEREVCAEKTGEFARKWWSIHCASNKHMETTRKAHDDFCALQAAIRARSRTHD